MNPPYACSIPGEIPFWRVATVLVLLALIVIWLVCLGQAVPLAIAVSTAVVAVLVGWLLK